MTKPIVKKLICYKPLYVIQRVNFLASADIWLQLPACMLLLIDLALFTHKVFLFSISLLFVNKYHYFVYKHISRFYFEV